MSTATRRAFRTCVVLPTARGCVVIDSMENVLVHAVPSMMYRSLPHVTLALGCVVVVAVIKHLKTTRQGILQKLTSIHALDLAGTRCDVLRVWLLLVFDLLWYVCIVRDSE